MDAVIYGAFMCGDVELAIDAGDLQELVSCKTITSSLPNSVDYFYGTLPLRGAMVPVIDVRVLLGQVPPPALTQESCVAVANWKGCSIGLLFDSTAEVLRIGRTQVIPLEYRQQDGPSLITTVISMDGDRHVRVLNIEGLAELEQIPLSRFDTHKDNYIETIRTRSKCIVFSVSGVRLALRLEAVSEVMSKPEIERSGVSSAVCVGQAILRGVDFPVLDTDLVFGLTAQPKEKEQQVVIARVGDQPVGFLVDQVDGILEYFDDSLQGLPAFITEDSSLFAGCILDEQRNSVYLIDHEIFYKSATVKSMVDIFSEESSPHEQQLEKSIASQADAHFFMVELECTVAIEFSKVIEIVNVPSDITPIAYSPESIRGTFYLRDTLVTVLDVRAVYGMPDLIDNDNGQLLIIDVQGRSVAIQVDRVIDMFRVRGEHIQPVPRGMLKQNSLAFSEDISEVILQGESVSCVLDVDLLLRRVVQVEAGVERQQAA